MWCRFYDKTLGEGMTDKKAADPRRWSTPAKLAIPGRRWSMRSVVRFFLVLFIYPEREIFCTCSRRVRDYHCRCLSQCMTAEIVGHLIPNLRDRMSDYWLMQPLSLGYKTESITPEKGSSILGWKKKRKNTL